MASCDKIFGNGHSQKRLSPELGQLVKDQVSKGRDIKKRGRFGQFFGVVQRSAKRDVRGLVKFVPAVAYLLCLVLLG